MTPLPFCFIVRRTEIWVPSLAIAALRRRDQPSRRHQVSARASPAESVETTTPRATEAGR